MSAATATVFLLASGCFGGGGELAPSGRGLPVVTVEFPEEVSPGETADARLSIENPGPGDIGVLSVTFVFVAPRQGQGEWPNPIVSLGSDGENRAVQEVSPEPRGVSDDGVVYTFEGLREGETTDIVFSLRVPEEPGPAANSLQVGDGQELERLRGVRLETTVRG